MVCERMTRPFPRVVGRIVQKFVFLGIFGIVGIV